MKKTAEDEFYIGYAPHVPARTARVIKRAIAMMTLITVVVCLLLAVNQRPFSDSIFDYGTLTEVEGVLLLQPVPNIQITNSEGQTHALLLVGFGKFGALPTLQILENLAGQPLNGRHVTLRGTRINGHGQGLLQITVEDNQLLSVGAPAHPPLAEEKSLTRDEVIYGEVVDPKCYFGVMKPGEGKPHRSCATRCLAGGIPPVVAATRGDCTIYVVLTGAGIQDKILPYVGEPLRLQGTLTSYCNWQVLDVATVTVTPLAQRNDDARSIPVDDGITLCSTR